MSKQEPLISVIVPIYNVEKYLAQCLSSITNQTYKNLEIICVNDGSPDNSEQVLKMFAEQDSRIKVYKKTNGGLSSARNYGLSKATGDYIGFVDSDDWISENYYEELLKACQTNNADLAYANILYMPSTGRPYPLISHNKSLIDNFADMIKYQNNGAVWSHLFRRRIIFDKNKLKFEFPIGLHWEDNLFLVQALKNANKECLVNRAIYFYRMNNSSIMLKPENEKRNINDRKIICERIWDLFKDDKKHRECIINYMINVVFDKYIVKKQTDVKKFIENLCDIKIYTSDKWIIKKTSFYLFGFLQLFRIIYDTDKYKFYLMYLPLIKYTVNCSGLSHYFYIFCFPIYKKDFKKLRLFLLGLPLITINWGDTAELRLFDAIPLFKHKRKGIK